MRQESGIAISATISAAASMINRAHHRATPPAGRTARSCADRDSPAASSDLRVQAPEAILAPQPEIPRRQPRKSRRGSARPGPRETRPRRPAGRPCRSSSAAIPDWQTARVRQTPGSRRVAARNSAQRQPHHGAKQLDVVDRIEVRIPADAELEDRRDRRANRHPAACPGRRFRRESSAACSCRCRCVPSGPGSRRAAARSAHVVEHLQPFRRRGAGRGRAHARERYHGARTES